ncbi:hypothetical protein J2751_000504 [Halorubrum alkaliphilum]|uniref:Uncharacterized protein n=1 Tax=Halorubrum alkaliphilum TaxID=261290 RepID=A0A8T4GDE9_9EURY|nr:hypothetical protein [Halorubrum alkaliphilum]MBP1921511.1 hypothetical protein [Halorubrum alkaliphilum]
MLRADRARAKRSLATGGKAAGDEAGALEVVTVDLYSPTYKRTIRDLDASGTASTTYK